MGRDDVWMRAFFAALPAAVTATHKTDSTYSDYSFGGHVDLRGGRAAEFARRIADAVVENFQANGELPRPEVTREYEEERDDDC